MFFFVLFENQKLLFGCFCFSIYTQTQSRSYLLLTLAALTPEDSALIPSSSLCLLLLLSSVSE
jgi:hypothetical protein